jgi:hypothetical protein
MALIHKKSERETMTDRIAIDEKWKEALIGLLPISSEKYEENFTPKLFAENNVPKEYHPVFRICELTAAERDNCREFERLETGVKLHNSRCEIVNKKLIRWENLNTINGEPIVFDGRIETVKNLPDYLIVSIFNRILKISNLTWPEKLGLES